MKMSNDFFQDLNNFLWDLSVGLCRDLYTMAAVMTKIRKVKVYLAPKAAERLTRLSRAALARCVRHGVLTHYRTEGNHRRYDLDELKAMRSRAPEGRR